MKVNFKKVIPLLMVGLTVAGSYSIFNAKPSKPDLYDFTGKVLKTTLFSNLVIKNPHLR